MYHKHVIKLSWYNLGCHRFAIQELIKLLVEKDISLDANINSQATKEGESGWKKIEGESDKKSDESALFLATKSNIQEIVKEVLQSRPQALKHTNKEGMNILHLAIIYRHIDIFNMVIKHEVLSRRLLSTMDNEGNSVLHMVSQKRKGQASEKMQSPALHLFEEYILLLTH